MVDVGVTELFPVPFALVDGTLCWELLPLSFLFKEFVPLLFPGLCFEPSIFGVEFGEENIPPIPESSNKDLSEDVFGDREIRCDCNGTDKGEAKGFGTELKCESSGLNA